MHAGRLHLPVALEEPTRFRQKKRYSGGVFPGEDLVSFAGVPTTPQTAGRRLCLPSALSTNSSR